MIRQSGSGWPAPTRNRATAAIGFCVADRPMRCRRAPHSASSRSRVSARCEPRLFEATAWISSTMTLLAVRQHAAAGFRAEQDVEQFRRGHEDMRRHAGACGSRSAAGVSPVRTQVRIATSGRPRAASSSRDAGERPFEVLLDVVRQRLQRRDVDDLRLVRELPGDAALDPLAHQPVDRGEERGQRLARAGRRRDQDIASLLDRRPCLLLRRGRRGEAAIEPGGNGGVEQRGEGHAAGSRWAGRRFYR